MKINLIMLTILLKLTRGRNAISKCNLIDIQLEEYLFTWARSRGTKSVVEEKLDRAMATADWFALCLQVKLQNLVAAISDHDSISLSCDVCVSLFH